MFCLQLPGVMYKKILVILHESIMPQMGDPTLMIDFLTAAYDIGEWSELEQRLFFSSNQNVNLFIKHFCPFAGGAISLLALNGLFVLIHKHNL